MTLLALHALAFVVVNTLLVTLWWLLARRGEMAFWPVWSLLGWGGLLAMHAGVTVVLRRARARRANLREGHRSRRPGPGGPSWIAVMFVDLVGSTRLSETLGDEAWSEMIAAFRGIVREAAVAHGGAEVGTQGDGSLLRFPSPADAVACASRLQRRLDRAAASEELPAGARIGVHAGRVIERDDDVLGRMVNVAARVADAAAPGEVLVTEPVLDHAGPGVGFDDRGLQSLKGIEAPRHLLALRPPPPD